MSAPITTEQSNPAGDSEAIVLTAHEVLTLLSLNLGEPSTTTRELFRLPDRADDSEVMEAGLSTLLVRGYGHLDGEVFSPVGPAGEIAAILTTASEWFELGIVTDKATYAYFLIAGAAGKLIVSVDRLSIYQFRPLNDSALIDQLVSLTEKALHDPATPKPAVVIAKHLIPGGAEATASIRMDQDGTAALAGAPATADGGLSEIETSQDSIFDAYRKALELDGQVQK